MPYIGQPPVTGDTTSSFRLLDNIASYTLTFNGSSAEVVSTANDTLTFSNHRFVTAQRVTYTHGGGTAIGGLTSGTAYYIIKVDQNTIKLATSAANANNNSAIDLTSLGVGVSHTLNVAFDGINTKFKATYNNGTKAQLSRAGQLLLSINGVIQQPQETSAPTVGFGIDADSTIVFSVAPAVSDVVFGNIIANSIATFDISDNNVDNFTGNGSTLAFTLSKTPANNQNVLVTLDGVVQYPSDTTTTRAYSVTGSTLTFVSAPGNGVEIQVRHIGFAGATSSAVTGFYGRTGNAVLTSADDINVQNITGVAATFTGNVSIAGTLTYEDVTNVDSVGLITARSGIIVNTGTATTALVVNGNARVTGILTIGTSSITLDGSTDAIRIGSGVTITSSGIVATSGVTTVSAGSTAAPSITPTGDTNTGIFFPSPDTIAFAEGGAEAARIDSSGRFGLGTSSPGAPLHIVSNSSAEGIRLAGRSSDNISSFYFRNNADSSSYGLIQGRSTDFRFTSESGSQPITFHTDQERVRITGAGNVGIGDNAPNEKLVVAGAIRSTLNATSFAASDSALIDYNAGEMRIVATRTGANSSSITFWTYNSGSTSERARIDSSGRLLVGTSSSPTVGDSQYSYLVVQGYPGGATGNANISLQRGEAAANITSGEQIGDINFTDSAGYPFAKISCLADANAGTNDYPGRLVFSTTADGAASPTERMRLDSSGRLGIGNTSPGDFNQVVNAPHLVIGNGTTAYPGVTLYSTTAGAGIVAFADGTTGNQQYRGYIQYDQNVDQLNLGSNGPITFNTGTERARIDSSGRLLVNFTSTGSLGATAPLQVRAADSAAWGINVLMRNSGNDYGYIGFFSSNASEQVGAVFCQRTSANTGSLVFETNNGGASATARFKINNDGQLSSVLTGGSTLYPGYMARVWINFDGTSGSIGSGRASGNVSSVTDNGTGDYTINFSTTMPDTNYCVVTGMSGNSASSNGNEFYVSTQISGPSYNSGYTTTSSIRMLSMDGTGTNRDAASLNLAVFR